MTVASLAERFGLVREKLAHDSDTLDHQSEENKESDDRQNFATSAFRHLLLLPDEASVHDDIDDVRAFLFSLLKRDSTVK